MLKRRGGTEGKELITVPIFTSPFCHSIQLTIALTLEDGTKVIAISCLWRFH